MEKNVYRKLNCLGKSFGMKCIKTHGICLLSLMMYSLWLSNTEWIINNKNKNCKMIG